MEIRLTGAGPATAETINVSANGVYFVSSHHIPALTKVGITLALPPDTDGSGKRRNEVFCEGVVVRVEPEVPRPDQDAYQIACYFTSISPEDQEKLESYILNQLAF